MKVLYKYLLWQIVPVMVIAISVLTFVLVLGNAFNRVADLLVNNDLPLWIIIKMIALLIPPALTFTIPWGMLVSVLVVFGRMSHDFELQAIKSAGIGLVPFIAPVILLSLLMTLVCFYNNAVLAPTSMTQFKTTLIDLGRENPTALLKAREPINAFDGLRMYVEDKQGNRLRGIYIWQLNDSGVPLRSVRAERGTMSADLNRMKLRIDLENAWIEERNDKDPTQLDSIISGGFAGRLPQEIDMSKLFDDKHIVRNISIQEFDSLINNIGRTNVGGVEINPMAVFTEIQKRMAFSVAAFTFVLVGIPLAITVQRRETSIGLVVSLAVAISYFLMIVVADALKEYASAYPDLIVWIPNLLFQTLGFYLIWRVNRQPI